MILEWLDLKDKPDRKIRWINEIIKNHSPFRNVDCVKICEKSIVKQIIYNCKRYYWEEKFVLAGTWLHDDYIITGNMCNGLLAFTMNIHRSLLC